MGRAFLVGDDIDTDVLAPGHLMKLSPDELARHCLEAVDPLFAGAVRPGDILFGGRNFGLGSSREQAAISLKLLGLKAVLAPSFARIFYRNAINIGLPALVFDSAGKVAPGDVVDLDLATGLLRNSSRGVVHNVQPLPPNLLEIVNVGGLIGLLKRRTRPISG